MPKKSSDYQLATKKYLDTALKRHVTKIDLKKTEEVLREEILTVEEKIEKVEDKLGTKIDNVSTAISNFAGRVETLEKENEIGADQARGHEVRLDNYEARISKLEPVTS